MGMRGLRLRSCWRRRRRCLKERGKESVWERGRSGEGRESGIFFPGYFILFSFLPGFTMGKGKAGNG